MKASEWWNDVIDRSKGTKSYALSLAEAVAQSELTQETELVWDENTVRHISEVLRQVVLEGPTRVLDVGRLVRELYPPLLRWRQYYLATLLVTLVGVPADQRLKLGLLPMMAGLRQVGNDDWPDRSRQECIQWSLEFICVLAPTLGWPEGLDLTALRLSFLEVVRP